MRKSISVLFALLFAFAVAGCAAKAPERAQNNDDTHVAALGDETGNGNESGGETGKTASIVVYFSRTGNTEKIAKYIVELTGSDSFEIEAKDPYTDADIDYNDSSSRTSREQNDPSARPEINGEIPDLGGYDAIYLGYPIWWGQAPKIMYTFVEACDLSGKTIVPFCTSASSGVGTSATNLSRSFPGAKWLSGKRFSGSASKSEVSAWLDALSL